MYNIKNLYWKLVYALQRAFDGYDYLDVCNLDINMEDRMIILLTKFRKYHMGLFTCPKEYPTLAREDGSMSEEDTNTIIDMMIYHIKMSREDYVIDKLFPKYNGTNLDYWYKAHSIANQNRDCAWKLLRLFWNGLWY